jgi:tetratricopeptide (TPR) repeat protein
MKAFIGHSFDDKDKMLVDEVKAFVESAGIECKTGEKAQNSSIAQKVKERIAECEIFVGVFTCDKPICHKVNKGLFCSTKKEYEGYTTSNWVLQESGFAIGLKREQILLVEKGVYKFPELQGDMEVIRFDRGSIKEQYVKLNQMLEGIKNRISGGATAELPDDKKQMDTGKSEHPEVAPKEEAVDQKNVAIDKIIFALAEEDYKKAQEVFDTEASELLKEDERVIWKAYILRESHALGDEGAFEKLQRVAKENEDNPRVIRHLAYRYKEMREFKKAEEKFRLAATKYDISNPDERKESIYAYIQAAWCLADDDNFRDAIAMLRKSLFDPNFQELKALIFKAMAEISKEKNDDEGFYTYAEAALDIDPCDTKLRFSLAYAYSNKDVDQLALLHYKKLTETTVDKVALNNLGVQYEKLKMPGKCVESYYKSADHNETLAMANLAQKYLNQGFLNNAKEFINRANKLSNEGIKPDYRVGNAQKRVNDLIEEENKTEEAILLEAEKERKFRVNYSKAFCSDKIIGKTNIEGVWETPWGNGQLNFNEISHSFNIMIQKEAKSYLPRYISSVDSATTDVKKIFKNININGTFEGLGGKYSVTISDAKKAPTLLTGEADTTGYLILNEGFNNMAVMEKTKDNKIEFKEWKKVPTQVN